MAYLALAAKPVGRAELASLLWGETGRTQAQQSLRQTLTVLRQTLGKSDAVLTVDAQSVGLDRAALQVDAVTFEALIKKGDAAALAQSAALYRGDFLAGFDLDAESFEEWLVTQRERYRELATNALTQLLSQQTAAKALDDAVQSASRLLALDPLHEPAHRALMRLYNAQGRRPAALRQYQTCVAVLRKELGVEPAAETKQVYAEMLRETTAAAPAPAAGASGARLRAQDRERSMVAAAATPFVGREQELDRARRALAAAIEGRGAIVAISGEAGVGKTRLARQLAAEAAERGAQVLIGRAYRSEQILPLGPWRDALRDSGVLENPETVLQASDPARLFSAMAELMDSVAATRPLLLVLEDLQWADDMTLRLLGYLGRRLARQRMLVVATVREEELVDAPAVRSVLAELDREGSVLSLSLAPLSQESTAALVRSLARVTSKADLERLGEQIWAASEGNAFMAVEILRAIEDGSASPAASASKLPLPERARQVVTGRLERLSEQARAALGVAAVIGRDFEFSLLQQAAQLDDATAATAVEELVRRRIFRVAGERFEFTHDRIREIVYGELLAPRRKLLHRQTAQAIRVLRGATLEPHYAALGAHAFEGEQWAEAAKCFRAAGDWAMARSFNREAAAALGQAVAALDREAGDEAKGHAVDLRLQLRNALSMSGELARGREVLDEARQRAAQLGDRVRLGRVAAHLSSDRWWAGQPAEALAAADEVARIAEETGDDALRLAAIAGRGYAFHGMGNYRAVHQTLEPLFSASHSPYGKELLPIVSPLHQAIAGLAHCGEFDFALARAREAVARAENQGHRYLLLHACWTLGEVHAHRAAAAAAKPALERALGLILDRSDFFIATGVLGCLGYVQVLGGEAEAGLARMREALGKDPPWRIGLSRLIARFGEAELIAGHPGAARASAERCLELTRRHGERGYEAWALRLRGEVALVEGKDSALEDFTAALALSEELGMMPMAAHCHAGLARGYRREGEAAKAAPHRETAARMYREMGMGLWPALLDADTIKASRAGTASAGTARGPAT